MNPDDFDKLMDAVKKSNDFSRQQLQATTDANCNTSAFFALNQSANLIQQAFQDFFVQ